MSIEMETIAAIATARGEASVGIIRVSGPTASAVAETLLRMPSGAVIARLPASRSVTYGMVHHPATGLALDEAICVWMPGPRSYTGEDVVELQVHGGLRVLEAVLEAALQAGARLAEPGEFTKRAFLNGRIDLSQAEAVMDMIRAKTDLAMTASLRQIRGGLRDEVVAIRKRLLQLEAYVEVTIDYPEHDVEDEARMHVLDTCSELLSAVGRLLESSHVGAILRDGIGTVILGRPNVGKSSLLNALLRRDRAIVTDIPGTTRDVLEEYLSLDGVPFRLVDTAGIRETEDVVERIGVNRSRESLDEAEIVILVLNGNQPLTDEDIKLIRETAAKLRVVVVNKVDLDVQIDMKELERLCGDSLVLRVSLKTKLGLENVARRLVDLAVGENAGVLEASFATNARQTAFLREARADLQMAVQAATAGSTLDIIAVQLQSAYRALGMVIGQEVGEDLLDEIFSSFCLGK